MRTILSLTLLFALLSAVAAEPQRFPGGAVHHAYGAATVTANNARPMLVAVDALRQEYGWLLDYEDPPYQSPYELREGNSPTWRAAHPNGPPPWAPAGGEFSSTFAERPGLRAAATDDEKLQVLNKVVSDYNQSQNPGNFEVRRQSDGTYVISGNAVRDDIGSKRAIPPILDTTISIPIATRTVKATIDLIAQTVLARTGIRIGIFSQSFALGPGVTVTAGGDNTAARDLLIQTLKASNRPPSTRSWAWTLVYDPESSGYTLTFLLDQRFQEGLPPPPDHK